MSPPSSNRWSHSCCSLVPVGPLPFGNWQKYCFCVYSANKINNYSLQDVKKKKTSKRAVIEDDEDDFVAEKEEEKHESESSSGKNLTKIII